MADPRENDDLEACFTAALASSDGMAKHISSLPLETRCQPFPLRQIGGFWFSEKIQPGVAAVHVLFKPRPDDIFLDTFPMSGTTWLKALAFATLNRAEHPPSDPAHPLGLRSPHDCVSFFELTFAFAMGNGAGGGGKQQDVFKALHSPRVLATHLPYYILPNRVTAESSGCRIVYVCRDPKDALVSVWLFSKKNMSIASKAAGAGVNAPPPYPLEEAFDLFCDGRCIAGPQWLYVLGFWEESQRRPDKVLFLRYEEMLRNPGGSVRKLAEFMGCPFSVEEEAAGMADADAVAELCSIDSLRASKGNLSGVTKEFRLDNGSFFRKGVAGDWRNHLTPEMAARLDRIVDYALQTSGFKFGLAAGDSASA